MLKKNPPYIYILKLTAPTIKKQSKQIMTKKLKVNHDKKAHTKLS